MTVFVCCFNKIVEETKSSFWKQKKEKGKWEHVDVSKGYSRLMTGEKLKEKRPKKVVQKPDMRFVTIPDSVLHVLSDIPSTKPLVGTTFIQISKACSF